MKAALQALIDRHLPQEGVAAWTARLPDRTCMGHCFTDWFTPNQVEQCLTRLALAAKSFADHHIDPVRLCWRFEHARIHLAFRHDGACLALFLENRPGRPGALLETVFEEFARLR
jgi:hypothetical protein